MQLGGGYSVGMQVKAYGVAFPVQGYGLALSPCLLYQQGPYSVGLIRRNLLDSQVRYADGHREPWANDLAIGFAWRTSKGVCTIDFTENLITRADISCPRLGYELTQFSPLVLRAGTNRDWSSLGFSMYWNKLTIDFAYLLHGELPNSYLVSLSYQGSKLIPDSLMKMLRRFSRALYGRN